MAGDWRPHVPAATIGRPGTPDGLVDRHDLIRPLLKACDGDLVVMCAPAGYGKTSAAVLWDCADDRPFAWARLDHLDDDPAHLLLHIATAVAQAHPISPGLLPYLRGPSRDVTDQLVPALVKELEAAGPLVIVIDDIHHVSAAAAVETLRVFTDVIPATVTVALVGRSTAGLDLARRRLAGTTFEIGPAELRFGGDEGATAFAAVCPEASRQAAAAVLDRCEGWPAGVALAAMALRDGSDVDAITGRHRLLADYLVEEVLDHLDAPTAAFVCEAAVLDRFCAAQLDEILLRDDSAQMLAALAAAGAAFLVGLDEHRQWYRFHRMVADLLRARLRDDRPARYRELLARAAEIRERDGDIDGALLAVVDIGDRASAARLVAREAVQLGFDGRASVLERRIGLLDQQTFTDHPDAAIARAWLGVTTGDAGLIHRSLIMATKADHGGPLADGTPSVRVAAALVGSMVGVGGVHDVVRHADVVRDAGDHLVNPWWGAATVMKGAALSMLGDLRRARNLLESALPVIEDLPGFHAAALAHLALLELGDGDDAAAIRRSTAALAIADSFDLCDVVPMVVVYATAAVIAARVGDEQAARKAVGVCENLLDRLGTLAARTALLGHGLLAWTGAALQDSELRARHLVAGDRAGKREPDAVALSRRLERVRIMPIGGQCRPLTAAELKLLPYLATHLSLQRVSEELMIGRETVKSQVTSIYRKLAVSSRAAAVVEAKRVGLLSD